MSRLGFLLAGAVLASAMGAGSAAGASKREKAAELGRKVMREFAECSVKREPELSRRYVLTNAAEELSAEDFQKLSGPRCLPAGTIQLQMMPLYYRGALAEELLRTAPGRPAVFDPAGHARLNWSVAAISPDDRLSGRTRTAEDLQKVEAAKEKQAAVGRLGECVVRAAPDGSRGVLYTRIDGPSEMKSLEALAPQIAACIKAGETASFNRTSLRAAIALSYYRLAMAPPKPEAAE